MSKSYSKWQIRAAIRIPRIKIQKQFFLLFAGMPWYLSQFLGCHIVNQPIQGAFPHVMRFSIMTIAKKQIIKGTSRNGI
jgi:hypothetical protein